MKLFNKQRILDTFRPDSEYLPFFLSLLAFGLGYGIYKGVIDNYLAEIVVMTEFDRGLAEFSGNCRVCSLSSSLLPAICSQPNGFIRQGR